MEKTISNLTIANYYNEVTTNSTEILHKNEVFHQGFLQQTWPNEQFPAALVNFIED